MSRCSCIKELLLNSDKLLINGTISKGMVFSNSYILNHNILNNIKTLNDVVDECSRNWLVGYYDEKGEYKTIYGLYKYEVLEILDRRETLKKAL